MPNVMIRMNNDGQLTLYVAKQDLEDNIVSIEHESADKWGGEIKIADGTTFFVEPMSTPKLPITVRAKRLSSGD